MPNPSAHDMLRVAVAMLTGQGGATPMVIDIATWLEPVIPELAKVWTNRPHWYGMVQMKFENGELVGVPVTDDGKRLRYKRYRG